MAKSKKPEQTAKQRTTEILAEIGKQFKETREAKGITLQALAESTTLSSVYISNLEKGRLENASIESLLKIGKELNITLSVKALNQLK